MLIKAIAVTACAVLLYIYGMYLMNKIDRFLEVNHRQEPVCPVCRDNAIVFGSGKAVKQICEILREHKVHPVCVKEVGFKREEGNIRYIITVSASDVDNLTMCRLAGKFYDLRGSYSICNEEENRHMYKRAAVDVLTREEIIQKICEFSEEKEQVGYERII